MSKKTVFPVFQTALVLFLLLQGCEQGNSSIKKPADQNLPGTWELADVINTGSANTVRDQWNNAKGLILKNGLAYNFFADGTYTRISGNDKVVGDKNNPVYFPGITFMDTQGARYNQGKWTRSGDQKTLTLQTDGGSEPETIEIVSLDDKFLTLRFNQRILSFSCDFKLRRTGQPLTDQFADPYHPSNNQWRVPPSRPESDEQIQARMKNHLRHYIALLEASLERKQRRVSLQYSPSVIQIYNGGIGIRQKKHWEEAFFTGYHSRNDAQKAIDFYTDILGKNISLQATGDWVKDDANVLRALVAEMDQNSQD